MLLINTNTALDGPLQPAEDDTNMPPIEFLPVTTNEEEQDEKTFEAYTGPDSDSEEDPPKPPPAPVSFVPGGTLHLDVAH